MMSRSRHRGSLLIVVLFVMVVLSLVALSLAYRTGLESRAAREHVVNIQLQSLSRSAVTVVLSELALNKNEFDHPAESWSYHPELVDRQWLTALSSPLDEEGRQIFQTNYEVIDEDGKLNILYASSDMLEKMGIPVSQIDGIYDWLDEDDSARAEGAENEYYARLPTAYYTKNKPVQELSELLLIKSITPAAYYGSHFYEQSLDNALAPDDNHPIQLGLVDLLTCMGDGKINLNTAPAEVLATLQIDEQAVGQIMGYRQFDADSSGKLSEHVFKTIEDIDQLQGLSDADREVLKVAGKFTSQYYRIFVNSVHRSTGQHNRLEVVVRLGENGPEVIEWR